ncbi:MAG: hypothetical protein F4X64_01030 [Chloroflexi bacterium]|nr:hypothetical protein [Chloroflexota bacterium]
MKYTFLVQNRHIMAILLVSAVFFVATWWLYPRIAEGVHTLPEPFEVQRLAAPAGFAAADEDSDTAFREGEAGFAAWVRIAASEQGDNEPRLDVLDVKERLEAEPDPDQSGNVHEIRGAGANVDWGLNFAIVELPMYAAVISPKPVENVTVYFDDQGWVVAYLPKGRPAAAIWKHGSAEDATADDPKANEDLEKNLLVLALNEVLKAGDINTVEHADVAYYDWANENCDAFALFSATGSGGASEPVKFVIPRTITEIQASAAVVLGEQAQGGDSITASVVVDRNTVVLANAEQLRNSAEFELDREVDEDGKPKTSLHQVVVDVSADNDATGVVMLVYDKP